MAKESGIFRLRSSLPLMKESVAAIARQPHRITCRLVLPPDQRPVGSRWGRFWQGTCITGFIRFAPRHCRPLVRRAQVGLAPGLMRDGAKRMNRLRRAVGFCRPSCNGAALDGFAWLSPWPTCVGCAARTGRPGVQLDAGRRKPGLPHLLHLRDWSGGLVLRL